MFSRMTSLNNDSVLKTNFPIFNDLLNIFQYFIYPNSSAASSYLKNKKNNTQYIHSYCREISCVLTPAFLFRFCPNLTSPTVWLFTLKFFPGKILFWDKFWNFDRKLSNHVCTSPSEMEHLLPSKNHVHFQLDCLQQAALAPVQVMVAGRDIW